MFLVSLRIAQKRLEICRACEYFLTVTQSCSTLGIGKKVTTEEGETRQLCGCIMPVKTKLKVAYCPLEKWCAHISQDDVTHIRTLVESIGNKKSITAQQNVKITELWNKAAGQNRNVSNCAPCVDNMYTDLKKILEQNDT